MPHQPAARGDALHISHFIQAANQNDILFIVVACVCTIRCVQDKNIPAILSRLNCDRYQYHINNIFQNIKKLKCILFEPIGTALGQPVRYDCDTPAGHLKYLGRYKVN